jgi:hypothetical protein
MEEHKKVGGKNVAWTYLFDEWQEGLLDALSLDLQRFKVARRIHGRVSHAVGTLVYTTPFHPRSATRQHSKPPRRRRGPSAHAL